MVRPLTIIYLVKQHTQAWGLMPMAFDRIRKFCHKYATDMGADYLCERLGTSFASDSPSLMCFLVIRENELVGHSLMGLDDWGGERYITILQYEMDDGGSPTLIVEALHHLEHWGRNAGATQWQAIARDRRLARVFRTFYGFEESGVLVRRPFTPLTATPTPESAPEGTKIDAETQGVRL